MPPSVPPGDIWQCSGTVLVATRGEGSTSGIEYAPESATTHRRPPQRGTFQHRRAIARPPSPSWQGWIGGRGARAPARVLAFSSIKKNGDTNNTIGLLQGSHRLVTLAFETECLKPSRQSPTSRLVCPELQGRFQKSWFGVGRRAEALGPCERPFSAASAPVLSPGWPGHSHFKTRRTEGQLSLGLAFLICKPLGLVPLAPSA